VAQGRELLPGEQSELQVLDTLRLPGVINHDGLDGHLAALELQADLFQGSENGGAGISWACRSALETAAFSGTTRREIADIDVEIVDALQTGLVDHG